MKNQGMVYLVGAGPGDPGLLTIKGLECLRAAQVVVYDFLAHPGLLELAAPGAELIYVGKKGGEQSARQKDINEIILARAKNGKKIVRLKGGDPFIFGRGGEEAGALARAGVPFEVVPGVTSAVAVPAYAGIPLTHREYTSTVAFVTGHEDAAKRGIPTKVGTWERLATACGTLVFLMGVGNLAQIARRLIQHGRSPDTPVAVIRWGTTAQQETIAATLATIAREVKKRNLAPPAIIVVGEVVALREKLNWYETKPLFGKRILVTRTRGQASALSGLLHAYGAEPMELPTIEVVPMKEYRQLDSAIAELAKFRWVIFTSANGVHHFFLRLQAKGLDARHLKGPAICAIGPATAQALAEKGIRADLVPREFRAEGIIAELEKRIAPGTKVLIVRAAQARDILPESLEDAGALVTVAPAYRTVKPQVNVEEVKRLLRKKAIAAVTFTSSSTVTNMAEMVGKKEFPSLLKGTVIACIGPITAETARRLGLKVQIVCDEYTIPALVEKLVEHFRLHPPAKA